jgi:uncharacterized protein involved in exopolysaccharide biosynthesis
MDAQTRIEQTDQVSLRQLLTLLWRARGMVLSITCFCTFLAGALALLLPKQYEATVLVSPVSNTSPNGRLADAVSSLGGGLSSLIGISVGGDSEKYEAIAVLQSQALSEQYIRDNDLLPVLFRKARHPKLARLWNFAGSHRPPTLWEGERVFDKIRKVTEDRRTGLVTIAIKWRDPVTAAKWANGLVKLTNDYLRAKAIDISEQHIQYLSHEAARTDQAEVRAAIYAVMESEIKNAMLARGPGDYALKLLDPAQPPEVSSNPKVGLWVLGGVFFGIILSLSALFLIAAWRVDTPPPSANRR